MARLALFAGRSSRARGRTSIGREELDAGRVDLSQVADLAQAPIGPIHPDEILREDFMVPLRLLARATARALHVPPNRIAATVNGERAVTAQTALRLARHVGETCPRRSGTIALAWSACRRVSAMQPRGATPARCSA